MIRDFFTMITMNTMKNQEALDRALVKSVQHNLAQWKNLGGAFSPSFLTQTLMAKGADPSIFYNMALAEAVHYGNVDAVRILLLADIKQDSVDLHHCIHLDVVELLLDNGADIKNVGSYMLGLVNARRLEREDAAARVIQRACANWIDKPYTADGKVGISARIGLRALGHDP